ncbi:MAG: hypothetical protein H5T96_09880, partial [Tissierellales bacterium]|nr:hypothetical protein [Tissierellales bacterium]
EELTDCYLRGATATVDEFPRPDCTLEAIIDWNVPDCSELEATVEQMNCTLEGEAYTYDEPPCVRPDGMNIYYPIYGYDLVTSSGSYNDACSAMSYLQSLGGEYSGIEILALIVEAFSLSEEENVYLYNGTTDCECIPDGWYFTEETMLTNIVFHVVDCVIIEVVECGVTTTTTTTEALECYLEGEAEVIVFPDDCTWNGGTAYIVASYDCEMVGIAEEITTTTTTTTISPTTTTSTTSSSTTTTTTTVI